MISASLIRLDVINPVSCLLIGCRFADVVILMPRVLMENFLFVVAYLFAIFNTDKAVTLVFNSRTVKKATYAEESRLFRHFQTNLFKSFNNAWIKPIIILSIINTISQNIFCIFHFFVKAIMRSTLSQ